MRFQRTAALLGLLVLWLALGPWVFLGRSVCSSWPGSVSGCARRGASLRPSAWPRWP